METRVRPLPARLASMIKFEHTLFALPFAVMSALVAATGIPDGRISLLVLAAMVCARTAAMTFNRIVDVRIDSNNPRTAKRELVTGEVDRSQALVMLVVSCALFVYTASLINPLALEFSPVALIVICGYSYTKRFTAASHFVLGLSLAIAPVGAWLAVTGEISPAAIVLGAAVMAWSAGFDIIYSLQDIEVDRKQGLHSLPADVGAADALTVSRVLHGAMVLLLVVFGNMANLGVVYLTGVCGVAVFLALEHRMVSPDDFSRVDVAFFTMNGIVSIALMVVTAADLLL